MKCGDIVIVGGGCYGTFYARQLMTARERGKAEFDRLLIVDRDPACQMRRELGEAADRRLVVAIWDDFFDEYLASPVDSGRSDAAEAHIVPSPLMPHLMYTWLVRRARGRWPGRIVETRPLPGPVGTPYDTAAPDGTRYLSHADWLCPTHCIEPALCPVTRAPRTWEMRDTLGELARLLGASGASHPPLRTPGLWRRDVFRDRGHGRCGAGRRRRSDGRCGGRAGRDRLLLPWCRESPASGAGLIAVPAGMSIFPADDGRPTPPTLPDDMTSQTEFEFDTIIIGGGPAGLCAAMYAGRGMLKSVILESGVPGGELLNTEKIEDYPGFESILGRELAERMTAHARKFGAEIRQATVDGDRPPGRRHASK